MECLAKLHLDLEKCTKILMRVNVSILSSRPIASAVADSGVGDIMLASVALLSPDVQSTTL